MGSFKGYGRQFGGRRRRKERNPKREGSPRIEVLEERRLLSGNNNIPPPIWEPTSTNPFDAQHGPLANLGTDAVSIYKAFVQSGGNTSQLATEFPAIEFKNGEMGLQVKSVGGDFNQFTTQLTDLGMTIATSSAYYGLVEGFAPINELQSIARMAQTEAGQPIYHPVYNSSPFQGVAYNESETSEFADVARSQFNVDGTGVTVGVLSDSVNQFSGGLAASYKTGDLNASNPVTVVQDGPSGSTDEGRAMLENIHDIAPGAKLDFATAAVGTDVGFANNIKALGAIGAQLILDDVGVADDPMFQDGVISQAIDAVTAQGATYFSAAGNTGPDNGYLSTFRPANGNIAGIGTGTFMNFNPSGGTNLELPITVSSLTGSTLANLVFEFDQPFQTQEPAGAPGVVTSQVNIYILNSAGTIVASGTNNNVAIQEPWDFIQNISPGSYFVAIQVVSGPNPGHVEFVNFTKNVSLSVSTQYGSAGGTYYPSSFGHETAAATIGVGAVPWWAPAPFLGQTPLASEPFSSPGPGLYDLNIDGTPISGGPKIVQNPTVSGADGGNTSFFTPNFFLNTTTPPFPGEPATSTNLVPASQQTNPVFFGTSAAVENVAGVAALMLQAIPQLTPAEIRQGLITGAESNALNGTAAGTWDQQGGFGFENAINAINAVDVLRVASTNPANGATVTSTPGAITVTFNKPVNFSTVSAADLTFTSAPLGVTVNVGTPIAVDNPTDPTIIQFPFSFTRAPGILANGSYTYSIQSPASGTTVTAEDGKTLVGSGPIKFTLADTTAPVVTGTSESGRTVTISFSKALDPSTVTLSNIFVLRQGSAAPGDYLHYIDLNADPRTVIRYNIGTNPSTGKQTFTVTLDYSALSQSELPSDSYTIVVLSQNGTQTGVTDLVGNSLDGGFTGSFPSGANGIAADFIQNLGFLALQAPLITTVELAPTPTYDTGIVGDQNTNVRQPVFIGQVFAPFPGTVVGLQVYYQFDGKNNGSITLGVGNGGRGFSGEANPPFVTTDANGGFAFVAPPLPLGFQHVQTVVVGEPDRPPLPGLASSKEDAFRIDQTPPQITEALGADGTTVLSPSTTNVLSSLSTVYLAVTDPVNPASPGSPFDTPSEIIFSALNPATAINISNYSLINTTTGADESQFIAQAIYNPPLPAPQNSAPGVSGGFITNYNGLIQLNFAPGLPAGIYQLVAHTTEAQYPGLTDAAGNPLASDFALNFNLQPQPVYVTGMALESSYSSNGSTVIGGEQSYFELPPTGSEPKRDNVPAPPSAVVLDFSNPLPYSNATGPIPYANEVQLIQSANAAGQAADGEFGTLGESGLGSTGTGFSVLPTADYTVSLYSFNPLTQTSTLVNQPGQSGNRLVVQLNQGVTLSADDWRVYLPNQMEPGGIDTRIFDIYGHQLDGENLGNQTAQSSTDFPNAQLGLTPLPQYEDLHSSGVYRQDDMSGDGVPGGAFMAGFTVVNHGNVVYARPDYVENPLLHSTEPDGSLAKPYPVLAPEGNPAIAPANTSHDPNGGLNSSIFFQPGNFNPAFNFSGDAQFERSALYAASQLTFATNALNSDGFVQLGGPVVVVALPGIPERNPATGSIVQAPFSLQAPAGNNSGVTNGSASVPFDTILVFAAGSTLKLANASLFVQNQGSALEAQGTATDPVNFTSYNDASIGGPTNNNPDTQPFAGDWGGIVFRNYDQSATPNVTNFPVDGSLVGPNGGAAISGASDVMSVLNYANVRFAGGAVPQGSSTFYSAVTLFNSRPAISNSLVSDSGGTGGTEAAIGADMDSFREDDTARGPLIRRVSAVNNSLNGLWLMSEPNGFIEPTNAISYPDTNNPSVSTGVQNYTFFEPLPFIVLAQFIVGQRLRVNTGGETNFVTDRLYIQPGVMIKFNKGSGLDVLTPGSSLNVGSRSYINGFDANPAYGPDSPGFVEESAADPQVLFTSIRDDTATTTLVPVPVNVTGESTTPTLGASLWGSVGIQSGAIAVINAATFKYGGGAINTPDFTIPSQSVLAFITFDTTFVTPFFSINSGTRAYITNNNFFDNFDAAMQIEPDGLLAGDPLRPLMSRHPFFRGNVMQGNGIDGLAVVTLRTYFFNQNFGTFLGPREGIDVAAAFENQDVNAVWDSTDLTYVLRGTLILAGAGPFGAGGIPVPGSTFGSVPSPAVTLTIQAALPGTLLADGETIPSPGQSVIVKLLNDEPVAGATSLAGNGISGSNAIQAGGAGFMVGVEDGVDPPAPGEVFPDPGAFSELRILGIPGNQTTGQQRVPVIITSLRDDTVGMTVRGVKMFNILESDPVYTQVVNPGASLTTPAAGDGGIIYIGGNSMPEYDPTNPFDGSVIQDADISYLTRIEEEGGGLDYQSIGANIKFFDWLVQKQGYPDAVDQFNSPMVFTISNSNLADFSSAGVFVHPANINGWDLTQAKRAGFLGEGAYLYMYNDTISNSGQGVHINSENSADTSAPSPEMAVLLNDTFYNDPFAIQTIAPQFSGTNDLSHVNVLAMNDIFDGSTQIAVNIQGQAGESQLQYNLFFNNATDLVATTNDGDFAGDVGAVTGDPQFVGPIGPQFDATAENFELQPTSIAIDGGRSEIGPLPAANAIYPAVDLSLAGGVITETRTNPATLPLDEEPGRDNPFGGFGFISDPRQIVTLPGSGNFSFPDEFVPVVPAALTPPGVTPASGFAGPSANLNTGTYEYVPISGVRDILGLIRVPDPNVPGVGFGSNPFIDIGAYQFVNLHPPQVTAVTETPSQGAAPVNFYTVGSVPAGASKTPWTINVTFSGPINPNSIGPNTVQLIDLGINPAQPLDQPVNLSGKLSLTTPNTLTISLAASGLTLPTDAYQLILLGSGSPVVTSLQGQALDGENTAGGTSTGAQLPLPSGNGYPGGNFFDSFIINTTPPSVQPGSLHMDRASDTNIVGDNITSSSLPTFDGTVSEPNPGLVSLAGQTVYLDIGVAVPVNGVLTTFFSPSQLPASLSGDAQYIRPDAGTSISTTGGAFQVTVGVDGANTSTVTNSAGLPDLFPIYNVGPDGLLYPVPGDDSGYYVARIRIVDESQNQSNPNDANAQLPFVVDRTPPTASFVTPTPDQVITSLNSSGQITFTVVTSKNIDFSHFGAASIAVVNAGADGVLGTADDAKVTVSPTFSVADLNLGTGGKGVEEITFSTAGTLTNNLYQVTLLNTGADAVRDTAGNVLASPVSAQFVVDVPSLAKNLYVEAGFATITTQPEGTRENPYSTISAAMAAAVPGDVVAVLPGVYTEQVTLKQFVRLLSADPSSTDSTVFFTNSGNALSTIIRAPFTATPPSGTYATLTATNLQSFAGLDTEVAGFTIASPLVGDPAVGSINPNAVAVNVTNSDIVLDKDYIIDAGTGIQVATSGTSALVPMIDDDGVIGNTIGVNIIDAGGTTSTTPPAMLINNDFAFNTIGLMLTNTGASPEQAYVASNIFWENHDQSLARNGLAIFSDNPGKVVLRNNIFSGNGASDASQAGATNNLGNGFDPAALNTVSPDSQGNYIGNPAFVFPIDPRPGSDGPANFFQDADFQLTAASAAIDNAWEPTAISTDLLGNSQAKINNDGFGLPNFGPRDVGAFEFDGIGTNPVGGAFRVVTTSLEPIAGEMFAGGATFSTLTSPTSVVVTFSQNVNRSSVNPTDLVLSGSAVNRAAPTVATSLTWIDSHTVQFNLSGKLNSGGTLDVSIPANSIKSATGAGIQGYSDDVVLNLGVIVTPVNPTPPPPTSPKPITPVPITPTSPTTPAPGAPPTPVPAPAPRGPLHSKKKKPVHASHHAKHHHPKPAPVVKARHHGEVKKHKTG
jgi:hypothetical protein